jgi:general stress protein 26
MTTKEPTAHLEPQFSSPDAKPTPWAKAREELEKAETYWVTTVRPDGRPHVTPLVAIWMDDAIFFCTGPTERKAKNLEHNSHCIISTGCNSFSEGLDLVIEGDAVIVSDDTILQWLADQYDAKYAPTFHFTVRDGAFYGDGGRALVYQIRPQKVLGFAKGETFSQTRWRFE